MEFVLYRRRELGRVRSGTPIGGHEVRGRLRVTERRADEFNRLSRVAELVDENGKALSDPPMLWDAMLVGAKDDLWSLSGIEFVDVNGIPKGFAQSWLLVPAHVHDKRELETRQKELAWMRSQAQRAAADKKG